MLGFGSCGPAATSAQKAAVCVLDPSECRDKLLVFFQGGGGCWRGEECDRGEPFYTPAIDLEAARNAGDEGIFDATNPENPFSTCSAVIVRYCTGDVHLGDRDAPYTVSNDQGEKRQFTIHHRGQVNAMAVLKWVQANFVAARDLRRWDERGVDPDTVRRERARPPLPASARGRTRRCARPAPFVVAARSPANGVCRMRCGGIGAGSSSRTSGIRQISISRPRVSSRASTCLKSIMRTCRNALLQSPRRQ